MAAAVLTGEVFKVVTGLPSSRMRTLDKVDFCPVTLTDQPGSVTEMLRLENVALVGAGAIGTAVCLIFRELGIVGDLTVVDHEDFDDPNVTTYSLGTRADAAAGMPKVDLIARELSNLRVMPIKDTAQDFINLIDSGSARWPKVVLGAVHDIEGRHELQRIYADLTLDGGTGGQAGTTLALREGLPTGPCIRCYYPLAGSQAGPSAEQHLHENTGLPMERIARGQEPLTEADLEHLSDAGRRLLEPHLGRPVCGLARLLGLVSDVDDFRPSAAFVAQQAAVLLVGALIARQAGVTADVMRDVEYDALYGPGPDMVVVRRPRPDCDCQRNGYLVERVRSDRRAGQPAQ